jgi:hypothetical protein
MRSWPRGLNLDPVFIMWEPGGNFPPPLCPTQQLSFSRNSFFYATIGNCEKDWIIMTRKKPKKRESHGLRSSLVLVITLKCGKTLKYDKESDQRSMNT